MFLDDFRVRQARGLGINNFFDIVYLRAGDAAKTGNIHDFSWDDHGFLPGRTWKTHFVFFSLLKFVTRYCSNNSNEKTLKFNKNHQMHRNSKQSRVFKKVKIDEKHRTSRIMSKCPLKSVSKKVCVFTKYWEDLHKIHQIHEFSWPLLWKTLKYCVLHEIFKTSGRVYLAKTIVIFEKIQTLLKAKTHCKHFYCL